jgi:hypothetical protein
VGRVEVLPAARRQVARDLGRLVRRSEAERDLGLRLLVPRGAKPKRVYELDGEIATIPLRRRGRELLLSEFRNDNVFALKKLVQARTYVEPLRVGDGDGLWIVGGEHVLIWLDRGRRFEQRPVRVGGNTLLWVNGDLTLRLQGLLTRAEALAIAREIR